MAKITIYSTKICPFCTRTKMLFKKKGVAYEELHIEGDRELMREMLERSKRKTVPQIFIDDVHVGGYDDLAELDAFGKLDPMLGLPSHNEPDVTQEEAEPT